MIIIFDRSMSRPSRKSKELAMFRMKQSMQGHDVYQETLDYEQSKPQTNSKRPRIESSTVPEIPDITGAMLLIYFTTDTPEALKKRLEFQAIQGLTKLAGLKKKESS